MLGNLKRGDAEYADQRNSVTPRFKLLRDFAATKFLEALFFSELCGGYLPSGLTPANIDFVNSPSFIKVVVGDWLDSNVYQNRVLDRFFSIAVSTNVVVLGSRCFLVIICRFAK